MAGPATPAAHFRLCALALASRLLAALEPERRSSLFAALPELALYETEAVRCWPSAKARDAQLSSLAARRPDWPLNRLAGLPSGALGVTVTLLLLLAEEDPDLAQLFEDGGGFISIGGLIAATRLLGAGDDAGGVLAALDDLQASGLIEAIDPTEMRNRRRYRVAQLPAVALLGMVPRQAGLRLVSAADLPSSSSWVPHRGSDPLPAAMGAMWRSGAARAAIIKGPSHNGRKTWAAMAAQASGRPLLHVDSGALADPPRWSQLSALAWLLDAVFLAELEVAPGETVTLPEPACGPIRMAIVMGESGAARMPGTTTASHIHFGLPDVAARRQHWSFGGIDPHIAQLDSMVLTSGNVRRAGSAARQAALLAGCDVPRAEHLRAALRGLRDARLDALARLIDPAIEPDPLFLDAESEEEFAALLSRCRHREALGSAQGNEGVRALFTGASGTGKTLAARHLGRALDKDVYRIDLSATVNKYIGETEKALERALSAAEELDVVLLLDEGDALMAKRTDVANSNDRYANLETNFLLQRIESFRGIIIVTSNDADRIDQAFARRMDAAITFGQPDELRRAEILERQLGEGSRASAELIEEVACRCALNGGQLRNVALHARLLALEGGQPIGDGALRRAVEREYRKLGASSPLRRPLAAVS